ncbi:MAG: HD domain-containing protein [Candidatus Binatia bacterium]
MLIRDPVHGDLWLGALETAVLDLPDVQRLRGVKQLGTASLVYPGALHTRFDHALGASAAAHRIVAAVRRAGAAVAREMEDVIAAGALLHDVTHVPFGHTLEDERRLFSRHDKGTRLARLLDGRLGEGLARLGIRAEIAGLLGAAPNALPAWAAEIIASTIDADLLDYLRRDAYFTGLAHDYDDRVFHYFTVADGHLALEMVKHGMDRHDARSEVIQLLRMRYFLTERVYYHHTKVVAGAMISKAVELALDAGALAEADLLALNDWTLLDRLKRCAAPGAAALIDRLERRELLKRSYVVSARSIGLHARADLVRSYHESRAARGAAERALAAEFGCAEGEVIVYCPALTVMKEAAARVVTSRGLRSLNHSGDPGSADIHALEDAYASLWRLYVFAPAAVASRAAERAAEHFGYPSEYAPRTA